MSLKHPKIIVAAVDTSPRASGVLDEAIDLAQKLGGKLVLVRAVGIPYEIPAEALTASPDAVPEILERLAREDIEKRAASVPDVVGKDPNGPAVTVGTVGMLNVPNGSINVVPGRCEFSLDLRYVKQAHEIGVQVAADWTAEQIDAGEDWVSYRLPDGSTWRDGVHA